MILSGDNRPLCRSTICHMICHMICHIICHMICKRKGPQDDVLGAFLSYLGGYVIEVQPRKLLTRPRPAR